MFLGGSHGSSGEDASNVADVPLHGMLRVRLGENPCVVSADDDMLVMLGFDKSEVSRSHESLIQALNAAFLPLISQLVAGLSGSGRARIQMRRQVIRRVDGTFANIVKWGTLEGSADGGTCQLFVVLDSDEEVCDDSGGMLEGLEQFVRDSADMIFLLEMRKGSLTCIKDEFPELPSIPMGFPSLRKTSLRGGCKATSAPRTRRRCSAFSIPMRSSPGIISSMRRPRFRLSIRRFR